MATTFSWRNYTRPTPKNLEYLAAALRRLIAVIAGTTIVMDMNKWVPFIILIAGGILDELKNFFSHVAEGEQEVLQVTIPADVADKVDISSKIISPEDPNKKA